MKKILLLLFASTSICLQAQYVGIKAGYNYTNMRGDVATGASVDANHGFYAGVLMQFPLSKLFIFQPELLYSRVGAKISTPTVGIANLTVDYISIPTLARFNIVQKVNLHTGPQFSFKADSSIFYFEKNGQKTLVDKKSIDSFDLSWIVGVGYETPSGFFIEARFVHGLTNAFERYDSLISTGFSTNYDFKNSVISVGMGFVF